MKSFFKLALSTLIFLFSNSSFAQFELTTNVQDVSCYGDSNGSITLNEVRACFTPMSLTFDTNAPIEINTLKNDGYQHISHGSGPSSDIAYSVKGANTSIGDVYITTGRFTDSIVFDTVTLHCTSDRSMFVACFDAQTDELLWANSATAGPADWIVGLGVEIVGDKAFVVGYMVGTTVFGTTTVVSNGSYQGFIAKYHIPSGGLDTVVQVGNAGDEECTNIHKGADDRLYVSGDFTNSISLAGNTHNAVGSYDLFVTCFDTSLTTNYWGATAGGAGIDVARDLVPYTDGSGTVLGAYVVGYYQNPSISFGPTTLTSAGSYDMFLAKVNNSGTWQWAKSGGGTGYDDAFSIDINSSENRLYVGGIWNNSLTYDTQTFPSSGGQDGYIMYLDTAGALDTLYQVGGVEDDGVFDLESVEDDYLVFAGRRTGSWTFGDSSYVSNGVRDAFVGKIGPNLTEIWGKNLGGSSVANDEFNSVSVGAGTRLHCAGYISGNASAYQAGLIGVGPSDVVVTNDVFSGVAIASAHYPNLAAGNYAYSLLDAMGNVLTDTLTIEQPDSILTTAVVVNATSGFTNDGSIAVSVSGGTPDYSYLWSTGDTTSLIDSLPSGTYSLTIVDDNSCTRILGFFVDTLLIPSLTLIPSDVTCQNTNNGSIDLTVAGGTPPFTFVWSTAAITEDLSSLSAGTYTVTVTDSLGQMAIGSSMVTSNPIHPDPIVGPISGATSTQSWEDYGYSVPSTNGSAFLWSAQGGVIQNVASNAVSIEWHAGPTGLLRVQETDANGCVGRDSLAVEIIFLGIKAQLSEEFRVYPNPASDLLQIEISDAWGKANLKMIDQLGRTVLKTDLQETTKKLLDVSSLSPGVYLLLISNTTQERALRIAIE